MKAILVIDMPKSCNDCPMMAWNDDDNWLGCYLTKRQTGVWCAEAGKPVDCPLKPMPERVVENVWNKDWVAGWNAYYDTLTDFEDDPLKKELEK